MTTINLNGKDYCLDWNFLSQEYMEQASSVLGRLGNYGKVAVMSVAALRGGDWNFDKTPDWVLSAVGKDGKKMRELSDKVSEEFQAFVEFNNDNAEGNVISPLTQREGNN